MQENQDQSLDQEGPLEKETATHSNILAWKIPWTGSLVGCSPWGAQSQTRLSNFTLPFKVELRLSYNMGGILTRGKCRLKDLPRYFFLMPGLTNYLQDT